MRTYEASTTIDKRRPSEVLEVLTDPAACATWSPVEFELGEDAKRLETGTRLEIGGSLAGKRVSFDLSILEASRDRLELAASGPFDLAARYVAVETSRGTELRAEVRVSGSGLRGRIASTAAEALIAGGALEMALGRIARTAAVYN